MTVGEGTYTSHMSLTDECRRSRDDDDKWDEHVCVGVAAGSGSGGVYDLARCISTKILAALMSSMSFLSFSSFLFLSSFSALPLVLHVDVLFERLVDLLAFTLPP